MVKVVKFFSPEMLKKRFKGNRHKLEREKNSSPFHDIARHRGCG